MSKTYIIKKITCETLSIYDPIWRYIQKAELDCYDFSEIKGYPETFARIVYSKTGITVLFDTNEKGSDVLARYHKLNEPAYTDSCVEFFFNPCPQKGNVYMNLELGAGGALLVQTGTSRYDRVFIETDIKQFKIDINIKESGWAARLFIPLDFILTHFPELSKEFSGNLQKCGDDTVCPHYSVWNKIISPKPDFHTPASFGEFILEEY